MVHELNGEARCLLTSCGWTVSGSQAEVDRQAAKHSDKPGHPTLTGLTRE